MRCLSFTSRLFLSSSFLIFAGLVSFTSPCKAGSLGIMVPSYFYPGSGGPGGVGDGWAAMAAAASQVSIVAILNPNSGPIPGPADPAYVGAMSNLEKASGKVIAYVYTNNGSTPLATVESQISTYIDQYGKLVDGFFLDGMNVLPSTLAYYQSLNSYIKGLQPSYLTIANPGQPFLNGVTPADYLTTASVLNIFEGPQTAPAGEAGFNNYPYGLNWFGQLASSHFANIVYGVGSAAQMSGDVTRATQLNAGYLYITDQSLPNPYAELPSYWDAEVSRTASTPEPSSFLLLLSGAAVCVKFFRGKKSLD